MNDNKLTSIVQALLNAKQAPADAQQANPLIYNPSLEQAASPNNIPMNPLVQAITQKLGLLSMLRNRSNAQVIDPSQIP